MKKSIQLIVLLCLVIIVASCEKKNDVQVAQHKDNLFIQDYSIKYYTNEPGTTLMKVVSDRNGVIQILSSKGLMKPFNGEFLYPGTIEKDGRTDPVGGAENGLQFPQALKNQILLG